MPFYFFFGLLGLVIGSLLAWFFLADHPFESMETPGGPVDEVEASLLAQQMEADGTAVDEATIVKLLNLHGVYVDGKIREAREAARQARLAARARARAAKASARAPEEPVVSRLERAIEARDRAARTSKDAAASQVEQDRPAPPSGRTRSL